MKIIVILSKGYFCREPLNTGEGWQVLEPDRLVMQIALAIGEKADNEIAAKPVAYYCSDKIKKKKFRQGPSIWIKSSAEFM